VEEVVIVGCEVIDDAMLDAMLDELCKVEVEELCGGGEEWCTGPSGAIDGVVAIAIDLVIFGK